MRTYGKTVCASLGILLVLTSVVGVFLVYLGPWRTCPDVGNSMGYEATSGDIGLLGVSIIVLVVGIVFLAISMSMRRARIPSDAAGHFGKLN